MMRSTGGECHSQKCAAPLGCSQNIAEAERLQGLAGLL